VSENAMDVVRRVIAENPGDRIEPCRLQSIIIGQDVLGEVVAQLRALLPDAGRARVLLIVDRTPIMRRGVEAKAHVETLLGTEFDVTRLVLDDGRGKRLELFPFGKAHGKSSRSLNYEHLYPIKRFRLIG